MTNPITKAERDELRQLHKHHQEEAWEAIPRLLAALEAAEADRDAAVALIDAAKSDTRPESFLEHAQAILAKCIAPYSCEQMKAVGDALAACYRKWELALEVAVRANEERDSLKAKLAEAEADRSGALSLMRAHEAIAARASARANDAHVKLAALVSAASVYRDYYGPTHHSFRTRLDAAIEAAKVTT